MMGSAVRIRASASAFRLVCFPNLSGRNRGQKQGLGGGGPARTPGASVSIAIRGRFGREREVEINRRRLSDGGRAVRAGLPERLERRLAGRAGLLELRRADRADEEGGLYCGPADRTMRLRPVEASLERAQLDLPCPNVLEGLRRPEEEVRERAGDRHEAKE